MKHFSLKFVLTPLLFFSIIFIMIMELNAVPAYDGLYDQTQPDGTKIKVRQRGDEFFNWHEDGKGYVIKKDNDKYWKYAKPKKGEITFEVISDAKVGKVDPKTQGIVKRQLPDKKLLSQKIRELRIESGRLSPINDDTGKSKSLDVAPDAGIGAASSSPTVDDGGPSKPIPVSGNTTIKNLVILACFKDHWDSGSVSASKGKTQAEYEALFNQASYTTDGAVGSVKEYYNEVSYGKLTMTSVVSQWVELPQNEAFYGTDTPSQDAEKKQMISDAIEALEADGFDFSQCDSDGDGWVDALTIIHSGHDQAYSGNASTMIWSSQGGMADIVTKDSVKMFMYNTNPALRGAAATSTSIVRIGVICHELGHFFGLPDLYDYSYTTKGLGSWALMAGGSWNGSDLGERPAHFCAWSKVMLGFAKATEVHSQESLSISNIEDNAVVHKIRDGMSNGEYFLLENKKSTKFDTGFPEGILITHIDSKSSNNDLGTWDHPAVRIEEADGGDSLKTAKTMNNSDIWKNSTALSGGFKDTTGFQYTNTMRYQSGNDYARTDTSSDYSYIQISNFSGAGDTMTYDLSTLTPTVDDLSTGQADYNVTWSASTNATKYQIEEGAAVTLTSLTDGAEDEDVMHENWAFGGSAKRSDGDASAGSYCFYLAGKDETNTKYYSSVQSMTSRDKFKLTNNLSLSFKYKSNLSSGYGYLKCQVSNDDGDTWKTLGSYDGLVSAWTTVTFSQASSHFTAQGLSIDDMLTVRFLFDVQRLSGWALFPRYGYAIDEIAISNTEFSDYGSWSVLSDTETGVSYSITGKANGTYAYRVRAYANSTWQNYSPAGTVVVSLGANSDPQIEYNTGMTVVQGAADQTISNTQLKVTDPDAGDTLTYTLEIAPVNGTLKNATTALAASDTFTQTDIDNNSINYTHTAGNANDDSFSFTVSDGNGGSIGNTTFSITVNAGVSAPSTQASSIAFSSVDQTSMTVSWTNGNGSSRIVAVKEGSGAITNPSDDTTYTASSDWSSKGTQLGTSGYYVVYNGSSNTVSLTNLQTNTAYNVYVFDYNGSAGSEKYLTSSSTGNPNSQTTASVPVKSLSYSADTFTESSANDGAISTTVTITLTNETFTGDVVSGSHVAATNVPAGLTAQFVRDSDTQITLTLTGNATSHADSDDISNLTITFANASFTGGDASAVTDATKQFSVNFNDSLPEIAVSGNSTEIADGDTSPSTADHTDFESANITTGTVIRTFTINNSGGASLTLSGTPIVAVSGTNAADFTVSSQPTSPVGASGSTTFQVTFDPSDAGTRTAELSIANDDSDENPYNFSIQGTGVSTASPEIAVSGNSTEIADGDTTPSTADHTDFESANVTTGTVIRTFTINNSGGASLTLSGTPIVAVSGTNAADFTVSSQPTSPVSASGSTTFQVTFDPSEAGTRTAELSIANDDSDENPYNFSIQGTGSVTLIPEISLEGNSEEILDGDINPSSADHTDFESTSIYGGTVIRTFTIKNLGTATLNINGSTKVAVSGANASDFTVSTDPADTVAASGSTTFQVTFDPSAAGTRTADLTIANDDSDENPYNFSIQGTGLSPTITVEGNSTLIANGDTTPDSSDDTDFGDADVSSQTVSKTYTIKNTGNADLNLTNSTLVEVSGDNPTDFSVTTQPTTPVSASGQTTFSVTFSPSESGSRSAVLSIQSDDATTGTYSFKISGTGTVTTVPEIVVNGTAEITDGDTSPTDAKGTDFGTLATSSGSISKTFTIQNTGNATLNLSGSPIVALSGTNSSDFTVTTQPDSSVSASGSTTFKIEFDPSEDGVRTAEVSITNDDSDENPFNFSIQGTGSTTQVSLTYSKDSFSESSANDGSINNTDPLDVTLTNDTFTGSNGDDFVSAGKLYVSNLPSGLTVLASRSSDTKLEVTITGTASNHADSNDVANLTLTFANAAFTGGDASSVTNYSRSDFSIDFSDGSSSGTVSLTMSVDPSAAGSTTPTGTSSVNTNNAISITATAATDYTFASWTATSGATVADSNSASTTVTLTADATVTANFAKNTATTYTLTMSVSPASSGTTSPTASSTTTMYSGIAQSITATAATGYNFVGWSASPSSFANFADSNSSSTTVTLTGDATVTAEFSNVSTETAILIMAVSPSAGGSTSPTTGSASVTVGVPQNIVATPASGYSFVGWSGSGNASFGDTDSASTTVTLGADATVTAQFSSESLGDLTVNKMKISMRNDKTGKDKVKLTLDIPTGFDFDETTDDFEVKIGSWEMQVPKGNVWKVTKKKSFKGLVSAGKVKVDIDENKKNIIVVTATLATIAGKVNSQEGVDVYLIVGDKYYWDNCDVDEKTSWKSTASTNSSGFKGNIDKFKGTYISKGGGFVTKYSFSIIGSSIVDPTGGFKTSIMPYVYLGLVEWEVDMDEDDVINKNNKYLYKIKDTDSSTFFLVDFDKGKWMFKVKESFSTLAEDVSKDTTLRAVLGFEGDTTADNWTCENSLTVVTKTTLSYKK